MILSRDDYRKIKNYSKTEMENWLQLRDDVMYATLRKEFNNAYKDELDNSIQNFLFAIAYTLHWNEDVAITSEKMASFMEDLFITVDMFRTGEYKPEEYAEELKKDGVEFKPYDYDKIYRGRIEEINMRQQKASMLLSELIINNSVSVAELEKVLNILEKGESDANGSV